MMVFYYQSIHPNQQYENLNRNHDRLYLKDCDCWLDVLELFEFVEFLLVPVENGHFQYDADLVTNKLLVMCCFEKWSF